MEDTNAQSGAGQRGVTSGTKRPIAVMPFAKMSPSKLPLGTSSFQVGKRPYLMNHGDSGSSSSGTKACFQPSDANSPPASTGDESNKKTQNPTPSPDRGLTSDAGNNKSVEASNGNGGRGKSGRRVLDPNMDPRKLKRWLFPSIYTLTHIIFPFMNTTSFLWRATI